MADIIMTRSKPKNRPVPEVKTRPPRSDPPPLTVQHPHAAGIDIHSDNHVVCVGPGLVKTFGAYTANLHDIMAHLREHGIDTVAMESTGVYWIPLFELLEQNGFECRLVEPGQLNNCGARPKTDILDCQWIQRLHAYGLLKGSFRPPESVRALRGYHRQRQTLIRYSASHVQHMQKALEQMNVKLTEVLADIAGVTGLAIIDAVLQGQRDPKSLAGLASPKCAKSRDEFALALEGVWQPEHLFGLRQSRELFRFHQQLIDECDGLIAAELDHLPDRSGDQPDPKRTRPRGRKKNDLRFDALGPLFQAIGVDLTAIEGIDVGTALVVLAEIGMDVSRFPTEKAFAAWLGLCPGQSQSNRTVKKKSPRKGKNRLARQLRMCAQAVGRTDTPLGMFYRRIRGRIGGRGAITATAHKLAGLIWRMLRHGREYARKGMEEYAAKMREQAEKHLRKKAAQLGYELTPRPEPAAA